MGQCTAGKCGVDNRSRLVETSKAGILRVCPGRPFARAAGPICASSRGAGLRHEFGAPFVIFLLYVVLSVRIPVLDRVFKPIPWTPTGIWETDPRLGYRHIPNTSGPHITHDFEVVYTIDENGFRITPTPRSSRGRVLVVGGSFAVGHGVEDHETFPYLLGEHYWTDYKVDNGAVSGWGTANCYLRAMEELAGDDPPVVLIYAMIWHHVERNYLRKEWLDHVRVAHAARVDGKLSVGMDGMKAYHPHFEIVDGHPQLLDIVTRKAGIELTSELEQTESRLTKSFIQHMHEASKSRVGASR